jgi:hypothetical protein
MDGEPVEMVVVAVKENANQNTHSDEKGITH